MPGCCRAKRRGIVRVCLRSWYRTAGELATFTDFLRLKHANNPDRRAKLVNRSIPRASVGVQRVASRHQPSSHSLESAASRPATVDSLPPPVHPPPERQNAQSGAEVSRVFAVATRPLRGDYAAQRVARNYILISLVARARLLRKPIVDCSSRDPLHVKRKHGNFAYSFAAHRRARSDSKGGFRGNDRCVFFRRSWRKGSVGSLARGVNGYVRIDNSKHH